MARLGVKVEVTEEGTEQRPQYSNLPNGTYLLHMEAAEVIEKNEGASDHSIMVKSTFEVLEPEQFNGRKLFNNYNLKNKSADAQRIGNEQFQRLLRAMGIDELSEDADTDELLFVSFVATIGLGKDSKEKNADGTPVYPGRPEIKTYHFPTNNDGSPAVMPEIGIAANQPATARPATPANDNRAAANTNSRPAPAAAERETPWKKKKAG